MFLNHGLQMIAVTTTFNSLQDLSASNFRRRSSREDSCCWTLEDIVSTFTVVRRVHFWVEMWVAKYSTIVYYCGFMSSSEIKRSILHGPKGLPLEPLNPFDRALNCILLEIDVRHSWKRGLAWEEQNSCTVCRVEKKNRSAVPRFAF